MQKQGLIRLAHCPFDFGGSDVRGTFLYFNKKHHLDPVICITFNFDILVTTHLYTHTAFIAKPVTQN